MLMWYSNCVFAAAECSFVTSSSSSTFALPASNRIRLRKRIRLTNIRDSITSPTTSRSPDASLYSSESASAGRFAIRPCSGYRSLPASIMLWRAVTLQSTTYDEFIKSLEPAGPARVEDRNLAWMDWTSHRRVPSKTGFRPIPTAKLTSRGWAESAPPPHPCPPPGLRLGPTHPPRTDRGACESCRAASQSSMSGPIPHPIGCGRPVPSVSGEKRFL